MTSYITRVNGENKTYKIIIDTDEEEKYKTIQDFCRASIDHSKPTSNIAEIIRCKDCKKQNECGLYVDSEPEWFCADGERKD